MFISGGVYNDSSLNSIGYEAWGNLDFSGDLGKNTSYKTTGFIGLTSMPLKEMGEYTIGYWWYDLSTITSERKIKKLWKLWLFYKYASIDANEKRNAWN